MSGETLDSLKETFERWECRGRFGGCRFDGLWIQHDAFSFAKEFQTGLKVGESPSWVFGHCGPIDPVNKSGGNCAVVLFLHDEITVFFLVDIFGVECFF